MSVNEYFYNNVLLLTKAVPPSCKFKKYFQKDMFNKSNTTAFIHVSHYLLNIYDEKRLKATVKWPILEKREEAIYCNDIRNYLTILSSENPDMKFPVMLKIYFLKASGTKFLIIMWKLSIIALRVYLKRKDRKDILWAPSESITNNLIEQYLNKIISSRKVTLIRFQDDIRAGKEENKIYIEQQLDDMNRYKTEIFKISKHIEILTQSAPVHPIIINRLKDIEDSEIISMWKESICNNITHLHEANLIFKELLDHTNKLYNIILNLRAGMVLDGSQLHINSGRKDSIDRFYFTDQLKLQDFISFLNTTFEKLWNVFEMQKLPNLLPLQTEVLKHCDTIKSMILPLREIYLRVQKMNSDAPKQQIEIQNSLHQRDTNLVPTTSYLCTTNALKLLLSPKIKFNSHKPCEDTLNRICESPIANKHKHLFAKYKHKQTNSPMLLTLKKDVQNRCSTKNKKNKSICTNSPYKENQYKIKSVFSSSPNFTRSTSNLKRTTMLLKCPKPNYFREMPMTSTPKYGSIVRTPTLLKSKTNSNNILERSFNVRYKFGSPIKVQSISECNINNYNLSIDTSSALYSTEKDKIQIKVEHLV